MLRLWPRGARLCERQVILFIKIMAIHIKNLNYKTMNTGSAIETYTNVENVIYTRY